LNIRVLQEELEKLDAEISKLSARRCTLIYRMDEISSSPDESAKILHFPGRIRVEMSAGGDWPRGIKCDDPDLE
jgi:hypothetical protein